MQAGMRPRSVRRVARIPWAVAVGSTAFLVSFAGCVTLRPPPRFVAPERLPSAAALAEPLHQRQAEFRGLRSLARLRLREGDEVTSARQVLIASRPDRLRVEVMAMLGTVFIMTVDHDRLNAYALREKTVYRGTPSRTLLARYARIDLDVGELIDLLLASPALPPADGARVSFDESNGWIRLSIPHGAAERAFWFTADGRLASAASIDADGDVEWRARFDEYASFDGIAVAQRIEIDFPGRQQQVTIRLQDPEVNPSMDDAIFSLVAADGVAIVDLDQETH